MEGQQAEQQARLQHAHFYAEATTAASIATKEAAAADAAVTAVSQVLS